MEHLKRTFRSRFLRFFASAVRNPVFYRKHPAFYNKTMTFSDFLSYLWAQITGVADAAFP